MTTPARKQYLDIKAQHPDAILLYQVGDFFETFDEDARVAARELQIVLTRRAYGPDEVVPLAGVPVHAVDAYAAKLVARGHRVAICEQVSPPGRGLVQRSVTRVLTPGTVTDPAMVPTGRDNYLVAVAVERGKRRGTTTRFGLAYVEASMGAFACTQWAGGAAEDALLAEIARLAPSEILISSEVAGDHNGDPLHGAALGSGHGVTPTSCPPWYFDAEDASLRLCRHFGVASLSAFGCDDAPQGIAAAGALLAYLERMNPALVLSLGGLRAYETTAFVHLDGRTWRALEVVEPSRSEVGRRQDLAAPSTLLATLDCTLTSMGARLLRRTLLQPLRERPALERRLDAVAALHQDAAMREGLAVVLRGMGDLERLTARVVQRTATPRELLALSAALARVPDAARMLEAAEDDGLIELRAALDPCAEVRRRIDDAVLDPMESGGRRLRDDASPELDQLVRSSAEARVWIAELEQRERERTGIKSLKVGYNKVFGYYLEVSHANTGRVPAEYQRKQTLTNAERYVTEDLQRYEALVLHAEEQISALEQTLYAELLVELGTYGRRLAATASALAQLDVWLALAEVAVRNDYRRPELCDTTELVMRAGRHPVVERRLDGRAFIPNDATFDDVAALGGATRIVLLTGPNMAGKSTYLRQIALITLLAHVGSFVPAEYARVGLVDRIFTRVGAEDDLAAGVSTFMLEMVETAYILRHATERSLVVLDEVGRGTSTRDGLAIARAVLEHLHDHVRARTLFATHYHELAEAAAALAGVAVRQMEVAEQDGAVTFLHRVIAGACDESYGVHVARMAGVPTAVTDRARDLMNSARRVATLRERPAAYAVVGERSDPRGVELAEAVASVNIAAITPLEALNLLFALQQRASLLLRDRLGE